MVAYRVLCWVLDALYAGRPIQRFWVLETVARIPYMVYVSVVHLYESLGWFRKATALKHLHFAEVRKLRGMPVLRIPGCCKGTGSFPMYYCLCE